MTLDLAATHDALLAALKAVEGVRLHAELGDTPAPPAVYLSPPELAWRALGPAPSSSTWSAGLVVAGGGRAGAELLRLLPRVVEAIEGVRDAVVTKATPGAWLAGTTSLPCYLIEIEV